ncbi:Uncharacterised protein [Klebsiella pneumoniae]|uniref:hypothetical protein n=2 Tax=Klebsiella pneumoniae TaxID=573 RepID=UPI000A38E696|nr:hypothetical protein [Klebsiella pneumoniae]MCB3637059.1 hypothetical protein [Klebsiella pneumoniae]OUI09591.1 hypothetical protein AZZ73_005203 [Klebsiella pneumoniae]QLU48903.1 hypothetical protein HV247_27365 [Klebsiella pneumoniae]SVL95867.1 Uncharacterised protein [Klebsiella pneumoniae]SVX18100.1 Uncharacterised protein [Klebsiella pneumoniae]
MPMFDLDGCNDANIKGNKTSSEELLKAKQSDNLTAIDNEAGLPKKKDEILGLKPGVYGFSIDLKALYRRIFKKRK